MTLHTIPVGYLLTNCYVISDDNGISVVIDPGDNVEKIIEYIVEQELKCEVIMLTHGHYDHTGALTDLLNATDAKLVANSGDKKSLNTDIDIEAADGATISAGDLTFTVITTPGHTPGGVCYHCGEYLFTGDTLFHDDIGRTDIPGGDYDILHRSLLKLAALPYGDETVVLPGHEEESTLGHERENNPHLK